MRSCVVQCLSADGHDVVAKPERFFYKANDQGERDVNMRVCAPRQIPEPEEPRQLVEVVAGP